MNTDKINQAKDALYEAKQTIATKYNFDTWDEKEMINYEDFPLWIDEAISLYHQSAIEEAGRELPTLSPVKEVGERQEGEIFGYVIEQDFYNVGSPSLSKEMMQRAIPVVKAKESTPPPTKQSAGFGLDAEKFIKTLDKKLNHSSKLTDIQEEVIKDVIQSLPHQSTKRFSREDMEMAIYYGIGMPKGMPKPTREKIINKWINDYSKSLTPTEHTEVREGREVEFAEWISNNAYQSGGDWYLHESMSGEIYSLSELYQLFLTQPKPQ